MLPTVATTEPLARQALTSPRAFVDFPAKDPSIGPL
jgi:hypothetical protein